jgi:hypothetical protein
MNTIDDVDYGIDLINKNEFDLLDPFELDVKIIQLDDFPNIVQKKFYFQTYYNWLEFTYRGESLVAVLYQYLYENIRQGKYSEFFGHLSTDKLDSLYEYLETTIAEETKHSVLWKHLVEKMYPNIEILDLDNLEYQNSLKQWFDYHGIIPALVTFYIGETVTLSTCSLLYQHSTNQSKKDFLEIFLREESKHLNGFLNLIRDIRPSIPDSQLTDFHTIYTNMFEYDFEYFGLTGLSNFVNETSQKVNFDTSNLDVEKKIFNKIKQNNWQQKFNKLILYKNFLYYKSLFPDVTQEEFNSIIDSKWVKYQT